MKKKPTPRKVTAKAPAARTQTPALRRKNLRTAFLLVGFSLVVASSIFAWRHINNQPAIPQGGSYGQTYHPQPQAPVAEPQRKPYAADEDHIGN